MLRKIVCAAVCTLMLAAIGCRKNKEEAPPVTPDYTGLVGTSIFRNMTVIRQNHGVIDPESARYSMPYAGARTSETTNIACIDSRDGNYYLFSQILYPRSTRLVCIKTLPSLTGLTSPEPVPDSVVYTGILFNKTNNTFYSLKLTPNIVLSEVQLTESTFSETVRATVTTDSSTGKYYPPAAAIDELTGDIFWTCRHKSNPTNGVTMKYSPSQDSTTIIQTSSDVFALAFSKRDDCFYGIACDKIINANVYRFVRMSREGKVTDIAALPFSVHRECNSAAMDNNRNVYILSTFSGDFWEKNLLFQVNTDGKNMRTAFGPELFQGLAFRYK